MNRNNRNNDKPASKFIGLAIVLLLIMPQLIITLIPIGIIGGLVYLIFKNQNTGSATASRHTPRQSQVKDITYAKKQPAFDECPTGLFCFHKDRGEHHVARGKEIDPWDRPDIDISKYQRRG